MINNHRTIFCLFLVLQVQYDFICRRSKLINWEDCLISNYQWGNEANTESDSVITYFLLKTINSKMNLWDSPEFAFSEKICMCIQNQISTYMCGGRFCQHWPCETSNINLAKLWEYSVYLLVLMHFPCMNFQPSHLLKGFLQKIV